MKGFVGFKALFLVVLTGGLPGCGSPSAFEQARELNTIEAWEGFLKLAPQGDEQRTAIERLAQLYWDKAESSDSLEDWEAFVDRGIGTERQRVQARQRFIELLVYETYAVNTVEAWAALNERSLQRTRFVDADLLRFIKANTHRNKVELVRDPSSPPLPPPVEEVDRCISKESIFGEDLVSSGDLANHPLTQRGLIAGECELNSGESGLQGVKWRSAIRPGVTVKNVSSSVVEVELHYVLPGSSLEEAARPFFNTIWTVGKLEPGATDSLPARPLSIMDFLRHHLGYQSWAHSLVYKKTGSWDTPSDDINFADFVLKWLDEREWRIYSIRVED